jgi:hypothetical protein
MSIFLLWRFIKSSYVLLTVLFVESVDTVDQRSRNGNAGGYSGVRLRKRQKTWAEITTCPLIIVAVLLRSVPVINKRIVCILAVDRVGTYRQFLLYKNTFYFNLTLVPSRYLAAIYTYFTSGFSKWSLWSLRSLREPIVNY